MRQKGILHKKKKNVSPIVWIFFLFIIIAGILLGNWYIETRQKISQITPLPTTLQVPYQPKNSQITIFPTLDTTMQTMSASDIPPVDTLHWKIFHDETFDFSFLYPPEWTVKATDQKQGQDGPDLLTCDNLQKYLRDTIPCTNAIQNHTIDITYRGAKNKNGLDSSDFNLTMFIYTSAGGGTQANRQLPLTINGLATTLFFTYESKDFIIQKGENADATEGLYSKGYLGPAPSLTITGPKSIWGSLNIFYSFSEQYLPSFVTLLKSIKS